MWLPERLELMRDDRLWRIGLDDDVAWIRCGTQSGFTITSAVPPIFERYATLKLPAGSGDDGKEDRHDAAVLKVLRAHAGVQPWWLGYLDTGAYEIPFADAPRVTLYANWRYVLVEAGPDQAAVWRQDSWRGALPDLMFPADRSWLLSRLWDDDWTCVAGSSSVLDGLLKHPELARRAREVLADDDMTPPGQVAL